MTKVTKAQIKTLPEWGQTHIKNINGEKGTLASRLAVSEKKVRDLDRELVKARQLIAELQSKGSNS